MDIDFETFKKIFSNNNKEISRIVFTNNIDNIDSKQISNVLLPIQESSLDEKESEIKIESEENIFNIKFECIDINPFVD